MAARWSISCSLLHMRLSAGCEVQTYKCTNLALVVWRNVLWRALGKQQQGGSAPHSEPNRVNVAATPRSSADRCYITAECLSVDACLKFILEQAMKAQQGNSCRPVLPCGSAWSVLGRTLPLPLFHITTQQPIVVHLQLQKVLNCKKQMWKASSPANYTTSPLWRIFMKIRNVTTNPKNGHSQEKRNSLVTCSCIMPSCIGLPRTWEQPDKKSLKGNMVSTRQRLPHRGISNPSQTSLFLEHATRILNLNTQLTFLSVQRNGTATKNTQPATAFLRYTQSRLTADNDTD
jgi:hypothetical protein